MTGIYVVLSDEPSERDAAGRHIWTAATLGMKAHIGVDACSGLVHTVVGTAANVSDINVAGALLASIRAKVEHPFRVIKQQFGFTKVRYRGLAKNTTQIVTLFALSNLWMARRRLIGLEGSTSFWRSAATRRPRNASACVRQGLRPREQPRREQASAPTRERERRTRGFRRPERTQAFLSSFGPIRQHFALKRHLLRASLYCKQLAARFDAWRLFTGLAQDPSAAF